MTQAVRVSVGSIAQVSRVLTVVDKRGRIRRWQLILKEESPANGKVNADIVFSSEVRPQVDAFVGMIKRIKQFGVQDIHGLEDGIGFSVDKPEVLPRRNGFRPDDPMLRLSNGLVGFASACFVQAGFKVKEKE